MVAPWQIMSVMLALNTDAGSGALEQMALKQGVSINPGPEWSTDNAHAQSRLRPCFACPSHQEIREGMAVLADVCRSEFGIPLRSANVARIGIAS